MYPPSFFSSTTLHPGDFDKTFLISSKLNFLSNSTFKLIECDTSTGILTQVEVILIHQNGLIGFINQLSVQAPLKQNL